MWDLGEDLQGDVPLAALEDVDRLLMRQSLEGLAVHANDLEVSTMVTRIERWPTRLVLGCVNLAPDTLPVTLVYLCRVFHRLWDMISVELDFEAPPTQPLLPIAHQGRQWNIQNHSQPNPESELMKHPVLSLCHCTTHLIKSQLTT